MKKSKWMIIGAMALAFGFVLAGCEHRAAPPSAEEEQATAIANFLNNTSQKEVAVAVGTTITIVESLEYDGGNADNPLLAGVTIVVSSDKTLTLNGKLIGSPGTTFIVESKGGVAGSGATNFYDEDGNNITAASNIEGTYVWARVTTRGVFGWLAEPKPADDAEEAEEPGTEPGTGTEESIV
jgi:hypothetical protein